MTAKEIVSEASNCEISEKSLEQLIINYAKQECGKQMNRCLMAYSANRHKSPLEIKEEIRKTLIIKFE